jgi:hypothetical protein
MTKTTLRNLILSLATFFVVGGGVLIAFLSVLEGSQTLEQQIEAVAAQNQQEEELLRLQRIAQGSEAERAQLESYFLLRESDSISFLSEIESIAPTFNLDLETTGLQQVNEDNTNWIQADFSVTGPRSVVQDFVKVLETIPYVSRVKSVRMTGARGENWQASIVIQVQLLSYEK